MLKAEHAAMAQLPPDSHSHPLSHHPHSHPHPHAHMNGNRTAPPPPPPQQQQQPPPPSSLPQPTYPSLAYPPSTTSSNPSATSTPAPKIASAQSAASSTLPPTQPIPGPSYPSHYYPQTQPYYPSYPRQYSGTGPAVNANGSAPTPAPSASGSAPGPGASAPAHPNAPGSSNMPMRYDAMQYPAQYYYSYGGYGYPGPGPGTMQNAYYDGRAGANGGANANGGRYGYDREDETDLAVAAGNGYGGVGPGLIPPHFNPAAAAHQPHSHLQHHPPPGPPSFHPHNHHQGPQHLGGGYQHFNMGMYPPNHPYAHGAGYPGYGAPVNGMYYGGGGEYGVPMHEPPQPPPALSSNETGTTGASSETHPRPTKTLNPAAQGFHYAPHARDLQPRSLSASPASFQPPAPKVTPAVVNGPSKSGTAAPSAAPIANGHPEPFSLGLEVNGDAEATPKPTDLTSSQTSADVSTNNTSFPSAADTSLSSSISSAAASTAPAATTSTSATAPPKPTSASQLKFTSSAALSPVSKTAAQTTSATPAGKKDEPLQLVSRRPELSTAKAASFVSTLSRQVPASVGRVVEPGPRRARRVVQRDFETPRPKGLKFETGKEKKVAEPGFVFGSIDTIPDITPAPAPITPAASVPAPKPQRAASTWAALVAGPSKSGTPDTLSIAPSSTLPSPRPASSLPLPESSIATPAASGATTPKSTTAALPPAPATPKSFNYAAAAGGGAGATGAGVPSAPGALGPDELGRLLVDGVRGKKEPVVTLPRGLVNTGNMCFANTILQVLVYCPPFAELLEELGKRLKADLARRTPLLEAMIIFLREFAPGPSSLANGTASPITSTPSRTGKGKEKAEGKERRDAFVPENVYDAMKENKRFDSMRRGYQEDAEEYLGFFLNTLHEELLALHSRMSKPPSRPLANGTMPPSPDHADLDSSSDVDRVDRPVSPTEGWLEVGRKQRTQAVRLSESRESAISRIFGGTLRSVLHTPGQKDSVTLEPYQPLQLDIDSPEVLTLTDALRQLAKPEIVPGVVSQKGVKVDATKQVYVDTFPPVLILHLKRFVYDSKERNVVKRSKPVAYGVDLVVPQEIISPARRGTPVKYKLFGVDYHHGSSASGGHYTVSVSRQDGSGWVHYDDESVNTAVPVDQVVVSDEEAKEGVAGSVAGREKCAYLLFYRRV